MNANAIALKPIDYASDQEVRWCPGCGDYAVLKAMQKTLAELNAKTEKTVFVSGIGCSSRFPYYMSTYGFHTIHGRAPAIATGIKLSNPELDIWVVTGDGDALSIGGNHLFHALRRNIDVQILLFNNEIYGLTKGQYSPTSKTGLNTPSTPLGAIDNPASPCLFALGSGATFIARAIDIQMEPLSHVLKRAKAHRGSSFVEIFQNCIVYNDDTFIDFTDKKTAKNRQLHLEHGMPMIFGIEGDKGLVFNLSSFQLEVAVIGEGSVIAEDILRHDENNQNMAALLLALPRDSFPIPMGVIYASTSKSVFDQAVAEQSPLYPPGKVPRELAERRAEITSLLHNDQVWTVE